MRKLLIAAVLLAPLSVVSGCTQDESLCQWEVTVHAEFWAQDCWGWNVTCDGEEITCKTVDEQPGEGCSSACDNDEVTCQGPALQDYVFRFKAPAGAHCEVHVGSGTEVLENACGAQEHTLVATGSPDDGPQPMSGDCTAQED